MMQMLADGYSDTEEKLLNEVFRSRWRPLPVNYNCQKRAVKLAPAVWNDIRNSAMKIKVIHYVGGKPWQSAEEIRRLDWEGSSAESMAPYEKLFQLWHAVRRGEISSEMQLVDAIPLAV